MHKYVLLLHVLAATIWTGGHLVLALTVLPRVLKEKSPSELLRFESAFERVGMPALVIQVITGLWMAYLLVPVFSLWFSWDSLVTKLILMKLGLLLMTATLAVDAKLRIIPHLSVETLPVMARRIRLVTLLSVLFVVVGVSFQTGPLL